MQCKICEAPIDDPKSSFCGKCGASLKEKAFINSDEVKYESSFDKFPGNIAKTDSPNIYANFGGKDLSRGLWIFLTINYLEVLILFQMFLSTLSSNFIYSLILLTFAVLLFLLVYSVHKKNNTGRILFIILLVLEIIPSFLIQYTGFNPNFIHIFLIILIIIQFYILTLNPSTLALFNQNSQ